MKSIRLFIIALCFVLSFATGIRAEYFTDVIVTSTDGIWTDSRAYTTLNAAITAVGADERTIVIASPHTVTVPLIVPANVSLKFMRDGAINNTVQLTINTKNIIAENRQIFTGTGDIDFAQGTIVKSSWFSDIDTAINLTNDDTITLLITKQETLHTDQTVGNNVILKWDSKLMLDVSAGITMSNIGQVEAGLYQIFSGAGNYRFRDGTILSLSWFNNLRAAITHASTNKLTLLIQGTHTVDLSDSIPSTLTTKIVQGGILSISPGVTLTYANANLIDIGSYASDPFSGTGSITITGGSTYSPASGLTRFVLSGLGHRAQYEVDALYDYGSGTSFTQATIESALTAIGTTNKATLLLRPGTWVISSNADWSAYTNVTFKIVPGAVISHGAFTVKIPNLEASLCQVFSGTGLITISGNEDVYPEWWGAVGDGVTSDSVAINKAIASTDGWVQFSAKTYIVTLTAIAGDYWDYRVGPLKDNMKLMGYGATLKLKDGESPDATPKRYQWFYSMEADPVVDNIQWRGITFDGNGANNYSYGLTPATDFYNNAFLFVWQGVTNLSIKDCTFKNNPGGNEIIIYDDNAGSGGVPLVSKNITISDNVFYENGLDTWDHTSIFMTGTDVNVNNNLFYQANIRQDIAVSSNLAMEMHGNYHKFSNNIVYNYRSGVLIGGSNNTVSNNTIRVFGTGVHGWRQLSTTIAVTNVTITGNHITIFDHDVNSLAWSAGVDVDLVYSASNIMIANNQITKEGYVYWSYGIRLVCSGSGETLTDVVVSNNKIAGVSYGITSSELIGGGTLNRIYISGNTISSIANDTAAIVANATGVYLYTDTTPTGYIFVNNNLIDNSLLPSEGAFGVVVSPGYANVFTSENKTIGTYVTGEIVVSASGATTINLNRLHAGIIRVTLTDSSTFTFVAPYAGSTITFILVQPAAGSKTVTWPTNVKWPGGTAPTLTTTANAVDIITLVYDGNPLSSTNYYNTSTLLDVK